MKLLGIDYGEAKVGAAFGDTKSKVATPFKIIKSLGWNEVIKEIATIVASEKIEKVIVGMPKSLTTNSSVQEKRVSDFVDVLRRGVSVPVEIQDESFTTKQAQRLLGDSSPDDDVSAMLILQAYLDRL